MHTSATAISISLLFSGALFISLWKSKSWRAKYRSLLPPGPSGLPWVGSVFDIDLSQPWVTYQEWGNRYGDLIYSQVLGKEYIIINNEKIAHELLDLRSSIYSDRPRVPSFELFDLGFVTPSLPYGEEWRKHRRALHLVLNKKEALKYTTMQLQKAHGLLMNLLTTPQDYEDHFVMFPIALIMELAYGYSVAPQGDPFVASLVQFLSLAVELVTLERLALLGAFPFLAHIPSWMPGGNWKKRAGDCRRLVRKVLDDPVQYVHDSIIAGTARKSMVHDIYLDKDDDLKLGFDKDKVTKEVAATAFIAATETTTSVMVVFLLAMVLHPDVQRQAQEEIDRVVGTDRLPNFGDRPNLPYVEAILLETLRWVPAVPLGASCFHDALDMLPYLSSSQALLLFRICGMLSSPTVALHQYHSCRAMSQDSERYPEPKVFNPDRYGSKLEDVASSPVFGFGRRVCPGRHLAEQSLWAAIVSILATLQIGRATDASGTEIEIHPKFVSGVTIRPEVFSCSIKARSSRTKQLIHTSTACAD
ncbi:hypothetical protein M404DRAFT_130775 [Pisolithus tinctorius Marx 270]|uniref:Cytochrome P450 n=1 Tax=Pisolithus tinctorius Marx 270 TaxID=870435 RepID=A0A0C3JLQ4_PISTI|nr:hypothetical protein M404DRAFT_130775 [Pisolithus tinctorius Marx 270]